MSLFEGKQRGWAGGTMTIPKTQDYYTDARENQKLSVTGQMQEIDLRYYKHDYNTAHIRDFRLSMNATFYTYFTCNTSHHFQNPCSCLFLLISDCLQRSP